MSAVFSQVLPHLGAALVVVCIVSALVRTFGLSQRARLIIAAVLFISLLEMKKWPIRFHRFLMSFVGMPPISGALLLGCLLITALTSVFKISSGIPWLRLVLLTVPLLLKKFSHSSFRFLRISSSILSICQYFFETI